MIYIPSDATEIGDYCFAKCSSLEAIEIHDGLTKLGFGVFMDCLELLVAFIQAYVFTMLSSVFIGLSRQEH
jgi:F-type H+-transporting ATPase subunit a